MTHPLLQTTILGLQTTHAVIGSGQPLLMLHGWGANHSLVTPLASKMADYGYTCYVPDLPGFGQTEAPVVPWSVGDYVQWVLAYLDAHHLEQVLYFGHSFGGRLGLVLGAEHSGRIIKMALADSAGVRPKTNPRGQWRLKSYHFVRRTLERVGMKPQAERLRTWYSNRYGSADYKALSGVMRETFIKVVNEDLLPYAARVKPSTLLFWGDQDDDTPVAQGRLLELTIPDAGLVIWEGAGHYSYLDRLQDTARVMDHFFKLSS
jgi:pimeloyl-ACP methyl ester carboxylesterase